MPENNVEDMTLKMGAPRVPAARAHDQIDNFASANVARKIRQIDNTEWLERITAHVDRAALLSDREPQTVSAPKLLVKICHDSSSLRLTLFQKAIVLPEHAVLVVGIC